MSTEQNITVSTLLTAVYTQYTENIFAFINDGIEALYELSYISWLDFIITFLGSFIFLYLAIISIRKEINYQKIIKSKYD